MTSSQSDTSSAGATSITATLPGTATAGEYLLASITIQTAPDSNCTAPGLPFACCTGAGTGTCPDAGTATTVPPSDATCSGSQAPDSCCTGNGTGTCNWTLLRKASCGNDLQVSIYGKLVQAGENSTTSYTWNFSAAGNPATFLGVAGLIGVSNAGANPVRAVTHQCNLDSTALTAPSVRTTRNNTLDLLLYSIGGNNSVATPSGYSLIYQHAVEEYGPDAQADELVIMKPQATGDQVATAIAPGDSLGFQLAISPLR